jgi:hypothetical protein
MNLLSKYLSPNWAPEDGSGSGGTAASQAPSPPPGSSAGAPASSTPTPSASPPPTSPTPEPTPGGEPRPSGGEALDFESIFEYSAEPKTQPEVQPVPQPVEPKPQEPVVPPQVAQPVPPTAPTPPAEGAVPRTPEAATPQARPQAALDRYDPGQLASHLASNEAQALQYVADNVFKLTPEEVEALETNVVETVPKLLAKVFVKSQQNVLAQLASMVPVMIQRQTVAIQKNAEGADKFYQRWPMIDRAQHHDLVMRYGAVYRQMHPDAELPQMIEDLGPMVMMAARIAPSVPAQSPTGQPANPAAQRAANGRSPPPSPFVPAGSVGPAASATAPELSPWEAMFRHEE